LKKALGHWAYGLLGAAFFWASPRFFAESFYNIKDIGFLATFIIGLFFLVRFIEAQKSGRSFLVGIVSAFAAAVRLLGGIFILFALGFSIAKLRRHEISVKAFLINVIALGGSFAIFLVVFYPASWQHPVGFFLEATSYMAKHPWDGKVLFLGKLLSAHDLPWYYLPVWMFITTPIPVLLFSLLGLVTGCIRLLKRKTSPFPMIGQNLWFVLALLFVGNLILVFVMKPTLYDGWRHFYFLYVPVILLAVFGVAECWLFASRVWRASFSTRLSLSVIALLLLFSPVFAWMIKNHPFEYVYFNSLARSRAFDDFEKDYWGVSELKGLEYIMRTDTRSTIRLFNEGPILQISEMLSEQDRHRIVWVQTPQEADYQLLTFRASLSDQPVGNEVFSVKVDGHRILSVLKNG
jgi:hypothetical protein